MALPQPFEDFLASIPKQITDLQKEQSELLAQQEAINREGTQWGELLSLPGLDGGSRDRTWGHVRGAFGGETAAVGRRLAEIGSELFNLNRVSLHYKDRIAAAQKAAAAKAAAATAAATPASGAAVDETATSTA